MDAMWYNEGKGKKFKPYRHYRKIHKQTYHSCHLPATQFSGIRETTKDFL